MRVRSGKETDRRRLAWLAALSRSLATVLALVLARPALADANDYVLDLDFTGGEREIDTKLGAASAAPNGARAAEAAAVSLGTGVNDRWFTELYLQFASPTAANRTSGFDAISWENVVRFAEPGEWPVDLGALFEIERPRAGTQGLTFTVGPMLQTDVDRLQINLNLLFSRVVDGDNTIPTQMGYQFQLKYRSDPALEFGMQALGDVGSWNRWGNPEGQSHRLGPALFGRQKLGAGRTLGYNAALLVGASNGAPNTTVRAQLDIEF